MLVVLKEEERAALRSPLKILGDVDQFDDFIVGISRLAFIFIVSLLCGYFSKYYLYTIFKGQCLFLRL